MKAMKVSITGVRELNANLDLLSKSTQRNVLRRVLTKAGRPMQEAAAALAPDDPNTGAPDLHRSILISPRLKNEVGKSEFAAVMKAGGTKGEATAAMRDARRAAGEEGSFAEVFVGPDATIYYAHLVEFGTAHHGPQPYMRPAYEQTKGQALDIIKAELSGEINKAVARMMKRKAAKVQG